LGGGECRRAKKYFTVETEILPPTKISDLEPAGSADAPQSGLFFCSAYQERDGSYGVANLDQQSCTKVPDANPGGQISANGGKLAKTNNPSFWFAEGRVPTPYSIARD
jgi:hypothetical protein